MARHNWDLDSTIEALRDPQERILAHLSEQLEQKGNPPYAELLKMAIRWATEEIFVNHIKHGNRYDAAKRITVDFEMHEDRVMIRSADEGEGFDPDQVPDCAENLDKPSGRGIEVTREFVAKFRGELRYLGRGNEAEITFIIDEPLPEDAPQ